MDKIELDNECDAAKHLIERHGPQKIACHHNILFVRNGDEWMSNKMEIHQYFLKHYYKDLECWVEELTLYKKLYNMLCVLQWKNGNLIGIDNNRIHPLRGL